MTSSSSQTDLGASLVAPREKASMTRRVAKWLQRLCGRYPADRLAAALRPELLPAQACGDAQGGPILAIECTEDPFYFGLFAAISRELRATSRFDAELIVVRSINGAVGNGWLHNIARSAVVGLTISWQWVRAYRGLANRVAHCSQSLTHPLADLRHWRRSRHIWRAACELEDFSRLQIEGVQVGDLIIDSYLRFRPSPRFEVTDPFVRRIIWQACRDIARLRSSFRSRRPSVYLTTHSTYIEHGIAVRVALLEGIQVRSFSFAQFGKRLTIADWLHTPDALTYQSRFLAMNRQEQRLSEAERQLRVRLGGGIDQATSYMRKSAYAASPDPLPDVRGAAVVFLHDFYDSPHVYHDLIFPDFWSWICLTIETLRAKGVKYYIKPHPNQIALSAAALQELKRKYDPLPLLPAGISNVQLADGGIACGVTVYGSVAHELAYLGVPTIACARHPHISFQFCRTAASVDEYRRLLSQPTVRPLDTTEMRRQALAFYYMHNLHMDEQDLLLRRQFIAFWKACLGGDAYCADAVTQLRTLRSMPAFKSFVASLSREAVAVAD